MCIDALIDRLDKIEPAACYIPIQPVDLHIGVVYELDVATGRQTSFHGREN